MLPFSWLYGGLMSARNWAFDAGLLKTERVGAAVISVGNLTLGGSGKTPLVEYVAERLLARGVCVAAVSRGYARASKGVVTVSDGSSVLVDALLGGDEPVQMARKLTGLRVVVGERRVEAARHAIAQLGAEAVVVDDGFQHRYLHRDHDILVVDARRDLGREPVLPAGYCRERVSSVARATMLVVTHAETPEPPAWCARLRRWYSGPIAVCGVRTVGLFASEDGRQLDRRTVSGKGVYAFSGIGDHGGFIRELEKFGLTVNAHRGFADHHRYTSQDLEEIGAGLRQSGASWAVTTEKDAVRLAAEPAIARTLTRKWPLFHTRIEPVFLAGREHLEGIVETCVRELRR